MSKQRAHSGLHRAQALIGAAFLASAGAGTYLLATDGSLWNLAVSHAVGLVVIVMLDVLFGAMNLRAVKGAYLPSLAAALLGFLLQLGDIVTAPQYNMTVVYFARYLFGLWAFDLLLGLQVSVIFVGIAGRGYAQHLARRRTRLGTQLSYSRRGFVRSLAGLAVVVAVAVSLGSVKLPPAGSSSQPTVQSQAGGPIANKNDLQVNSPVYFEFPAGLLALLLKKEDESLVAVSALCTHVCCECAYDSSSKTILCPCHYSVFDQDGNVIRGPASLPLPKILLNTDSQGNVFPVRVEGSSPCMS